ncbi:hypothetical protein M3A03_27200, partial [Klebsiella pneumoniae]|nr:hypothetical protein [Klebsiella pneumoniae]
AATAIAAAAAATPVPFSDAFTLVPIQVAMIAKISYTFFLNYIYIFCYGAPYSSSRKVSTKYTINERTFPYTSLSFHDDVSYGHIFDCIV